MEPYRRCRCELPDLTVAAESPDLNINENAFNIIQSELSRIGLLEGWPKMINSNKESPGLLKTFRRVGLKKPSQVSKTLEKVCETWKKDDRLLYFEERLSLGHFGWLTQAIPIFSNFLVFSNVFLRFILK